MALLRPLPEFVPCRRGDKSLSVKYVQEWLGLNGFLVKVDHDFGPATEAAVELYCEARGIANWDGRVDLPLFELMSAPLRAACADKRSLVEAAKKSSNPLRFMVVAVAEQHLAEHPREIGGQNRGPWVRYYMGDEKREGTPWAWCAGFVNTVEEQACRQLNLPMPYETSLSCELLKRRNKSRFVFDAVALPPKPGDPFLVPGPDGEEKHTGVVIQIITLRDGSLAAVTIEGNTNDEGSREGYEVCRRVRRLKGLDYISIE